jgi:6-phosphofructokinase 1
MDTRARNNTVHVAVSGAKITQETLQQQHFNCDRLPGSTFASPMLLKKPAITTGVDSIVSDVEKRIMYDPVVIPQVASGGGAVSVSPFTMRVANARRTLHFDPASTTVGIVTCGGLCPGLNDVIRGLTYEALRLYGARRVIGFKYGYWGLSAAGRHTAVELCTETLQGIHHRGGTFLGTSRGPQSTAEMVDTLQALRIDILFTIGGDGTQKGASLIAEEVQRRGFNISVMGIPKTIDNDLSFSQRTFGFETAVSHAVGAIRAAHAEASSHSFGIGIVKVMGRDSGFIAAHATVSSQQVDICLVPENPITLDFVLRLIETRFETAAFCVICVAEGFGQGWGKSTGRKDLSGNARLIDIGAVLTASVKKWMAKSNKFSHGTVKYIDPSYMIRACPPTASDASFCVSLAALATHEAFSGTTNSVITFWYSNFIVVPIRLATAFRKVIGLKGKLWLQVREVTVDERRTSPKDKQRDVLKRRLRLAVKELEDVRLQMSKL